MPSSIVLRLMEEVAELKATVASLLLYQKWTMGLIGGLVMAIVGVLVAVVVKR